MSSDDDSEEYDYRSHEMAGGFIIGFGKHSGKQLGHVADKDPGYLEWVSRQSSSYSTAKDAFRHAYNKFIAGLSTEPGEAIVPFGKFNKHKKLKQCHVPWLDRCLKQQGLWEKYPKFMEIVKTFRFKNYRHYEVTRDIGESTAEPRFDNVDAGGEISELSQGDEGDLTDGESDLDDFIEHDTDIEETKVGESGAEDAGVEDAEVEDTEVEDANVETSDSASCQSIKPTPPPVTPPNRREIRDSTRRATTLSRSSAKRRCTVESRSPELVTPTRNKRVTPGSSVKRRRSRSLTSDDLNDFIVHDSDVELDDFIMRDSGVETGDTSPAPRTPKQHRNSGLPPSNKRRRAVESHNSKSPELTLAPFTSPNQRVNRSSRRHTSDEPQPSAKWRRIIKSDSSDSGSSTSIDPTSSPAAPPKQTPTRRNRALKRHEKDVPQSSAQRKQTAESRTFESTDDEPASAPITPSKRHTKIASRSSVKRKRNARSSSSEFTEQLTPTKSTSTRKKRVAVRSSTKRRRANEMDDFIIDDTDIEASDMSSKSWAPTSALVVPSNRTSTREIWSSTERKRSDETPSFTSAESTSAPITPQSRKRITLGSSAKGRRTVLSEDSEGYDHDDESDAGRSRTRRKRLKRIPRSVDRSKQLEQKRGMRSTTSPEY